MDYILVDLEATCWEDAPYSPDMEIIEIGAARLKPPAFEPESTYVRFVRPVAHPQLSPFCRRLTSIQQRDIDAADDFKTVFPDFLDWIGAEPYLFCSWGSYDLTQFHMDCERHGIGMPTAFENHLNLKTVFSEVTGGRRYGMRRALDALSLPLEGTHHRALADVLNLAKIARVVLPKWNRCRQSQ